MADSNSTLLENGTVTPAPRPVVIDADPGVDDVQAIGMMLSADRRGEVRVLALTVTIGNSPLKQCIRNARRALAILGRLDIPIYAGAHCGLVNGRLGPADLFHGKNGLGDAHFEEPLPKVKQQKEHAVSALVRLAREHKGELSILALAPLTNIAMAMRMDPEFSKNIKDIYVMGGNYTGLGNTTPTGEFNFYSDPEAANIVLSSVRRPITMACWELCLNHYLDMAQFIARLPPIQGHDPGFSGVRVGKVDYHLDGTTNAGPILSSLLYSNPRGDGQPVGSDAVTLREWRQQVLGAVDSAAARFFNASEAASLSRQMFLGWVTCDQVAAALLLRPKMALKSNLHHATVELQGEYTRGQMVVDRRGWHAPMEPQLNVNIVETLDMELYKKMLLDAFDHPDVEF